MGHERQEASAVDHEEDDPAHEQEEDEKRASHHQNRRKHDESIPIASVIGEDIHTLLLRLVAIVHRSSLLLIAQLDRTTWNQQRLPFSLLLRDILARLRLRLPGK